MAGRPPAASSPLPLIDHDDREAPRAPPSPSPSGSRRSSLLPSLSLFGALQPASPQLTPASVGTSRDSALHVAGQASQTDTRLRNDLLALMQDESTADVVLIVGEDREQFKSHRIILTARSDYFRNLLAGSTSPGGGAPIVVELTFLDPDAFRIVLRFLYTADEQDPACKPSSTDWRLTLQAYRVTEFLGIRERSPVYSLRFVQHFHAFSKKSDKDACLDMWTSADHYGIDNLLVQIAPEFWRIFGVHSSPTDMNSRASLLGGRLETVVRVINAIPSHLETPISRFRLIRAWLSKTISNCKIPEDLDLKFIPASLLASEVEPSNLITPGHLLQLYRSAALRSESSARQMPAWSPLPLGYPGGISAALEPTQNGGLRIAPHKAKGTVTYCMVEPVLGGAAPPGRYVTWSVVVSRGEGAIGIGVSADVALGSGGYGGDRGPLGLIGAAVTGILGATALPATSTGSLATTSSKTHSAPNSTHNLNSAATSPVHVPAGFVVAAKSPPLHIDDELDDVVDESAVPPLRDDFSPSEPGDNVREHAEEETGLAEGFSSQKFFSNDSVRVDSSMDSVASSGRALALPSKASPTLTSPTHHHPGSSAAAVNASRFIGDDGGWALWNDGSLRVGHILVGKLRSPLNGSLVTFGHGVVVTCKLDTVDRALGFEVGGVDCGIAFRNLPAVIFASVSVTEGVSVVVSRRINHDARVV